MRRDFIWPITDLILGLIMIFSTVPLGIEVGTPIGFTFFLVGMNWGCGNIRSFYNYLKQKVKRENYWRKQRKLWSSVERN